MKPDGYQIQNGHERRQWQQELLKIGKKPFVFQENHSITIFIRMCTSNKCSYYLIVFLISIVYIFLDDLRGQILVAHGHRSGVGQSLRGTVIDDVYQQSCSTLKDHASKSSDITLCHNQTLPFPFEEHWSHATNSIKKLSKAMKNPFITALEVDVTMGYISKDKNAAEGKRIPILSHEGRHGDLSVEKLMNVIVSRVEGEERRKLGKASASTSSTTNIHTRRKLSKHIKFDFKDIHAIGPVIQYLQSLDIDQNNKMIYLNADILPFDSAIIEADYFLKTYLNLHTKHATAGTVIDENSNTFDSNDLSMAFSLGYNTFVRSLLGFRETDLTQMASLIKQYHIMDHSAGVVLPINARVLSLNMLPFDLFLDEFPSSQILVWTGRGEPPLSQSKYRSIKNHFFSTKEGRQNRIGFDCKVASNFITGTIYDFIMDAVFYLVRLYFKE